MNLFRDKKKVCKYCKEQFDYDTPGDMHIDHFFSCLFDNCFYDVEEEE